MTAKQNVTASVRSTNRQLSRAERRAAEIASLSTQQARLKQEAAERRARRAGQDISAPGGGPQDGHRRSEQGVAPEFLA